MRNDSARHERKLEHTQALPPMLIDAQIQQPRDSCPIYTWERERESMRLTGMYRAQPGLPADLAVFQLEGQLELPMLLLVPRRCVSSIWSSSYSVRVATQVSMAVASVLHLVPPPSPRRLTYLMK